VGVKLSATVITFNEERNVGRLLASLAGVADEVVILDSGSTDRTEAICRGAGATFVHQPWLGYGRQKNAALDHATYDWTLSLDADEALSSELRASILGLKEAEPTADVYGVNRLNQYRGRFLRHSGWYPDRKLRLWRRGTARWSEAPVHEVALVAPGSTEAHLPGDLLHFTYSSREAYVRKIESFAELGARELLERGQGGAGWKRFVSPGARFVRTYLLQRGFLDGAAGFDACVVAAWGVWRKYSLLRKLQSERSPSGWRG
jgi:glycosyltransferase involved in cell wall biosynthesis